MQTVESTDAFEMVEIKEALMKERWDSFVEFVAILCYFACVLFCVCLFLNLTGKVLAPIVTFMFVAAFTFATFTRPLTMIMSVVGIALFAISWPVTSAWGFIPGQLIWSSGVLLWFWAVLKAFVDPVPTPKKVVALN